MFTVVKLLVIRKQVQLLSVFIGAKEECVSWTGTGDDSAHSSNWPSN